MLALAESDCLNRQARYQVATCYDQTLMDRNLPTKDWMIQIGEHPLLRRRPIGGLAVSTALVVGALAVRLAMGGLLLEVPYITFYSAVAINAFVGGWRAGLFVVAFCALGAGYFLVTPPF